MSVTCQPSAKNYCTIIGRYLRQEVKIKQKLRPSALLRAIGKLLRPKLYKGDNTLCPQDPSAVPRALTKPWVLSPSHITNFAVTINKILTMKGTKLVLLSDKSYIIVFSATLVLKDEMLHNS